jgi:hypothetical protein
MAVESKFDPKDMVRATTALPQRLVPSLTSAPDLSSLGSYWSEGFCPVTRRMAHIRWHSEGQHREGLS